MNEVLCLVNVFCSRPVFSPRPICALHRTQPEVEQRIDCREIYRPQDRNFKAINQPNVCDSLRYSTLQKPQDRALWNANQCTIKEDF